MLADFGVAKILGPERSASLMTFRTHTGALIGTPSYMSPESARGVTELTGASDIYSLGVLAYRLLVGRLPFPFVGDVLATLEAQINGHVPSPADVGVSLPPALEEAVLRALAKDPSRRPAGADELWSQLAEAADASWPRWRDSADLGTLISPVSHPGPPTAGQESAESAHTDQRDHTLPTVTGFRTGDGSSTVLPTARIASPVFVPKKRRRWPGLVAAAVVGVGIAIGLLTLIDSSPAPLPLTVESVVVTTGPLGVGHCPASFLLTGRVRTNGGSGVLAYQWSLAGRPLGPVHQMSIRSGETGLDETTRVVATQTAVASTEAVFRVLHPTPQSSATATLSCTALEPS
jgi:hypothetical protein